MKIIVVDTNIIFSALRSKNSVIRNRLKRKHYTFYAPRFLFVELFKHKERILKNSFASEDEVLNLLSSVLHSINFINEDFISTSLYMQAYLLCKDIDEKDTSFIAMALALECEIWTRDEELKNGLKAKGFDRFIDEQDFD